METLLDGDLHKENTSRARTILATHMNAAARAWSPWLRQCDIKGESRMIWMDSGFPCAMVMVVVMVVKGGNNITQLPLSSG